jgi:hypothetical protein
MEDMITALGVGLTRCHGISYWKMHGSMKLWAGQSDDFMVAGLLGMGRNEP